MLRVTSVRCQPAQKSINAAPSRIMQYRSNPNTNPNNNKSSNASITYEEIGLFPRSFNRVFDRFFKQLFADVENLVVEEYRFYRYLFLTTVKCLALLIFMPLFVNILAKKYVVGPLSEYIWNTQQSELFLNVDQQKQAFEELKQFEEQLYFDLLTAPTLSSDHVIDDNAVDNAEEESPEIQISRELKTKTLELAIEFNERSIEAITNFFSDLLSFLTLCYLVVSREAEINITKSFLLEVFFGLDDSKKSLVILLVTDLLVGYHSPNIWEFFFQFLFKHYGLPESQTGIFLLVATLPVLLDVLFKYLIFRHLNRASPSTVAVYHSLIE